MFDLYLLVYLCGYMVTAVTVTVFWRLGSEA